MHRSYQRQLRRAYNCRIAERLCQGCLIIRSSSAETIRLLRLHDLPAIRDAHPRPLTGPPSGASGGAVQTVMLTFFVMGCPSGETMA